ncbi:hypothetical protein HY310_02455, partial [Candidatus Microgenomates bacterium]|nr:hypothetical protein [Candidatus Microgenomates bacterium]
MGKYWVYFGQNISSDLVYRLKLLINATFQFILPISMIWVFSYRKEIVVWYLTTGILLLLLQSGVDDFIADGYLQGEMANMFLKPVNFWKMALTKDLSRRFLKFIFSLPILMMTILITRNNTDSLLSLFKNPVGLIILPISFTLIFLMSAITGLFCFWTEEVWGLQHVKNIAILFLSGSALPYTFFPDKFREALMFTPFPYLTSWPLWISKYSLNIFIPLTWVLILYIFTALIW